MHLFITAMCLARDHEDKQRMDALVSGMEASAKGQNHRTWIQRQMLLKYREAQKCVAAVNANKPRDKLDQAGSTGKATAAAASVGPSSATAKQVGSHM